MAKTLKRKTNLKNDVSFDIEKGFFCILYSVLPIFLD